MKYLILFLMFIILNTFIYGKSRTLTHILKYYETISKLDIQHHISRREIGSTNFVKEISFFSHKEQFELKLRSSDEIFAPDFEAVAIGKDGVERKVDIHKHAYYKGHDIQHENAKVFAHVENGMLTASIYAKNETYIIEPMWRHDNSLKNEMIVYKFSNVNWNFTDADMKGSLLHPMTCGVNSSEKSLPTTERIFHSRKRREIVTEKNTCQLVLVADYLFYKNMGNENKQTAIDYMLQVADRVNRIFRETEWSVGKNIGFQVRKTIVYDSFTQTPRFNEERSSWNVDTLLQEFSYQNWTKYCLAHLFTYQDFAKGVIGLAYVASPILSRVGGICTTNYRDQQRMRFLNCALSSSENWGRRLLTIEADLVTAHELGHNFGANHDPSGDCAPAAVNGGKYIMYATSVSGERVNNKLFSSCSQKSISKVLEAKRRLCFENQENAFCGNSVVEDGEECDSGLKESKCCNIDCKFHNRTFQCSDENDACCKNCLIAPETQPCREKFEIECNGTTLCNGRNKTCPQNSPPLSGNDCGFRRGICEDGSCLSICSLKNKTQCTCAGENSCKVCCKDSDFKSCEPYMKNSQLVNEYDGIACLLKDEQGQCVEGKCQKSQQNVEDEFTSLLKDFTFSKFARFLEQNIVGTILFFSLLVWIPASCIVNYIDKRDEEHEAQMKQWLNPSNKDLTINAGKWKMLFKGSSAGTAGKNAGLRTQYHISS